MASKIPADVLEKLTATEQMIVKEFVTNGGSPKAISKRLNVSVRTVYKALYKFRKELKERGISPDSFYLSKARVSQPSKRVKNPEYDDSGGEAISLHGQVVGTQAVNVCEIEEMVKRAVREVLSSMLASAYPMVYAQVRPEPAPMRAERTVYPVELELRELTSAVRTLHGLLAELNANIESLIQVLSKTRVTAGIQRGGMRMQKDNGKIPSYMADNPWLEVLRNRGYD